MGARPLASLCGDTPTDADPSTVRFCIGYVSAGDPALGIAREAARANTGKLPRSVDMSRIFPGERNVASSVVLPGYRGSVREVEVSPDGNYAMLRFLDGTKRHAWNRRAHELR